MTILGTMFLVAQTTYSDRVAPILAEHCARCHRPGEAAPFSLLTYEDARRHARQILTVTRSGFMPPWPPEPGIGDFAGGRRLTSSETALIAQWVEGGMPAGDLSKVKTPQFIEGWQLGEPDLILRMPQPFPLPAGGGDVFRNFVLPVDLKQTHYIRAIELRPGNNKRAVHHANVMIDRTRSMRARQGLDGQPGFAGMEVETESGEEFEPDSHFLFWKPGNTIAPEPEGMAWRLDPGTDLVVNMHLQPTGKPETIQSVLGLYFDTQPPKRFPILVQLEHDGAIDVAPGAKGFAITDHLALPVASDLLAIYPHAHYVGKRIEAWAVLPGGRRVTLLTINDWNINWQASYTYRKPVPLPAGTTVAMRIQYDNSADNPRNPSNPPKRVKAGNRSEDEMGHVWLQLLPKQKDDRLKIHEAVMRRRLQKYPADFVAHYNLGCSLQAAGKNDEALTLLRRATQLRPASATARNAYGAGLMVADRIEDAIAQFEQIVKEYDPARFNLGRALAAKGDGDGAAREWTAYLARNPEDGKAHYMLGGLLAGAGRFTDALPHIRRAAELHPDDAEIAANLGSTLAMINDMAGAIREWERALALNPNDAVTRANLARARRR